MRTVPILGHHEARDLDDHLIQVASNDGLGPVAISVIDYRYALKSASTMDGVKMSSIKTAHDKAVTALLFERDTVEFMHTWDESNGIWVPSDEVWTPIDVANACKINPVFVSWAGGSLIRSQKDNSIVGAVGVSARTELEDHDLASRRPHRFLE